MLLVQGEQEPSGRYFGSARHGLAIVEPGERAQWTELAARSRNIFATPEWLETWWRHFGCDRPLLAERCYAGDGRLIALIPLYVWRSFPLRVLRFVGHGQSDALGPICAAEHRTTAVEALRTLLARERFHAFIGEELPAEQGWTEALQARLLRRRPSPLVQFGDVSWDGFLESIGSRTRKKIRYEERRLAEQGVRHRLADVPERLPADLDTLFALHRARFPRGKTAFGSARVEAFHREFAPAALERGWLYLRFLELDGRAIASSYCFRFENAEYDYNGGWDPAWARWSVGSVLVAYSIRSAIEDRLAEYKFLRGGEPFKYHFASEDPGVETVAVTPGPVGRTALSVYFGAWTLRRRLAQRRLAQERRARP
jgi:CelD/BcsL family acetyltransferase involved in cellulose biosynthesis